MRKLFLALFLFASAHVSGQVMMMLRDKGQNYILLECSIQSDTSIRLSWHDNHNRVSYDVMKSVNQTSWTKIATVNDTSYIDTAPSVDTSYFYRIIAVSPNKRDTSNTCVMTIRYVYELATDEYLSFPGASKINFGSSDSLSISLWMRIDSLVTASILIKTNGTKYYQLAGIVSGALYLLRLRFLSSGVNYIEVYGAINDVYDYNFSKKSWVNIVFTYNGSSNASGVKIYCNGNIISTTTAFNTLTGDFSNTDSVKVCQNSAFTYSAMRMWDKVLSSSDVTSEWNNGIPASESTVSGCVFDHMPHNDSWSGSLHTLNDQSASPITGRSVGAEQGDRKLYANFRYNNYGTFSPVSVGANYISTYSLTRKDTAFATSNFINNPIGSWTTVQSAFLQGNTVFIGGRKSGSLGYSGEPIVFRLDTTASMISPPIEVVSNTSTEEGYWDYHRFGVIYPIGVDSVLVSTYMTGVTPTSGYSAISRIMHKDAPYPTLISTLTDTTLGYPQFQKLGSTLYCVYRGQGAGYYDGTNVTHSANNGRTWTGKLNVSRVDAAYDRAYHRLIYDPTDTKIRLLISARDDSPLGYKDLYFLQSYNGEDWFDVDSSYTNDVTGGYISNTEINNYEIVAAGTSEVQLADILTFQDTIFVLYVRKTTTPDTLLELVKIADNGFAVDTLNVSGWAPFYSAGNVSNICLAPSPTPGKFHLFTQEWSSNKYIIKKRTSTDYMNTWGSATTITPAGSTMQSFTDLENYTSGAYYIFGSILRSGKEETDLFVYKFYP